MARSPKQRFIDEVNALLDSVSVTSKPDRTLVSHALHDALIEILAEVNRSRTNWQLVAALTGAKSYVVTTAVGQSCNDPCGPRNRRNMILRSTASSTPFTFVRR